MAKKKPIKTAKKSPSTRTAKPSAKKPAVGLGGKKTQASKAPSKPSEMQKPPTFTQSRSRTGPAANHSRVKPWTAPSRSVPFNNSPVKLADPDEIRRAKTALSARELKDYRTLLLKKRHEILGDMKSMSSEALKADESNLSHMPLHMADVGSDQYEQELTLGLVESERKLLQEINEALERIENRSYGVCQATGKAISKERLQAKPWAKYTIEAARELERNGGRM